MGKTKDMTAGNPTKLILFFAFPLILTNLGQQLYMIVDSAIVGRGVGVKALAAVGATDWIYWMLLWAIQGLTQGFAIYAAQYFGRKDYDGLNRVIAMSTLLCAVFGMLFTLLGLAVEKPLLTLMQTPADIYDGAVTYLTAMIFGTLIVIAYNMAAAILRALGDGKTPLIAMCIAAVLNILLDLLFVISFQMGILGAALATLISQLVSFLYCFFVIRKLPYVQVYRSYFRADGSMISVLCRFGIPLALQNFLIGASGTMYQAAINVQGSVFVAGVTASNKVFGLLESSSLSLGAAANTFTAQNYGAGNIKRMETGVKASLKIVVFLALAVTGFVLLSREFLLQIFINPAETDADLALEVGKRLLTIISCGMIVLYLLNVFRCTVQGFGNSVYSMISGILEAAARVVVARIGMVTASTKLLFLTEPLSWVSGLVFIAGAFFVVRKRVYAVYDRQQ